MRLDHLLSKEHTPRCQANVLARMVVFTSGIVDGQSGCLLLVLFGGLVVGGRVGYSWPCVGGGWGQAHCWVLRDQPRVGSSVARVWLGFWSSLCCCAPCAPGVPCGSWGWGVVVLVGLLFEICIVDASIL